MEPARFLGEPDGGGIQPMSPCLGCGGCGGCTACTACAGCDCGAKNAYWSCAAWAIGFVGFGLW